jgi:hypothetical protein
MLGAPVAEAFKSAFPFPRRGTTVDGGDPTKPEVLQFLDKSPRSQARGAVGLMMAERRVDNGRSRQMTERFKEIFHT